MELFKYSCTGNDFILLQEATGYDGSELARVLCPRRTSLGADGLIVLEPKTEKRVHVIHYEPNGERTFCVNALRAAAHRLQMSFGYYLP